MSEFERMNGRGYVARVRFIDEDEAAIHVELENKKGIIVTLEDCDLSEDVEIGSVVFLGTTVSIQPRKNSGRNGRG